MKQGSQINGSLRMDDGIKPAIMKMTIARTDTHLARLSSRLRKTMVLQ